MRRVWEAIDAISVGHSSKTHGWASKDTLISVYPAWLMRAELRKSLRCPKSAQCSHDLYAHIMNIAC